MMYTYCITHKRRLTLLCYCYINKEKQGGRIEKKTGRLLAYHIILCFSPVVGQLLVCIQTAGHHIATLQFIAICGMDSISALEGTNVSEHCCR